MRREEEIISELKQQNFVDVPEAIPEPPKITEDELNQARRADDLRSVPFEWYRFVGSLCMLFVTMDRRSPACREIALQEYYVLVGLLNRCARLMLSNIALSHEQGGFGETTAILDRCIFESAVKIIWLTNTTDEERFRRFIADGLKTELEFKELINAEIASRGGGPQVIEKRMLGSIERSIASSEMSANEIADAKRLPDLASMIDNIWRHRLSRLAYVVGQRIGSHHVHGTWVSLRMHYLKEKENGAWTS